MLTIQMFLLLDDNNENIDKQTSVFLVSHKCYVLFLTITKL